MTSEDDVLATYTAAVQALGYSGRTREADEVIDLHGARESGVRDAHFVEFYPTRITDAVDQAAQAAREFPEALLSEVERQLLDLILRCGAR
jgi:hypothetical protein